MRICIAYESKYGNGKQCMEYLRDVLSRDGHNVGLFSVREKDPKSLPEADVYVFSSPTQIGSPARRMKKFLKKMEVPNKNAKYALVATHLYPDANTLEKMEKLVQPKGLGKVTEGLKIQVTDIKGPCESGFREKLDTLAKYIVSGK